MTNKKTSEERKTDFIENIDFNLKCDFVDRKGGYCSKTSTHNFKDNGLPIKCNLHKLKNMINFYSKICMEDDCVIIASFMDLGNETEYFCRKHKKEGMFNFRLRTCVEPFCKKTSLYNEINEEDMNKFKQRKPLYCRNHKKDGMINTIIKRCCVEKCFDKAIYGVSEPSNCKKHKTSNMEYRNYPICLNEDCFCIAQFNYDNESRVKFCVIHKLDGMIKLKTI